MTSLTTAGPTVSLLMTTYRGEQAERLRRSLEMTFQQSHPPGQVILVLDGPVGADQEQVIQEYSADRRIAEMRVVRLDTNQGLASALNAGLEHCTGEWIMRMDSDDESLINRTEIQLAFLRDHPDVDLLGTWATEYYEDSPVTRVKSSPVTHDAIAQALKWRNLICHPSVMMRATALRAIGGYRTSFPFLEDWDLFVRFVLSGARLAAIPKALVRVRCSEAQTARRGGWRYVLSEVRFRVFCWQAGFISLRQLLLITSAYTAFRLAGTGVRGLLYATVRTQEV